MSARGIKVNHDGNAGISYASWEATDFIDPAAEDFSICGWMRIKGASTGSNNEGQTPFSIPGDAADFFNFGGVEIHASDANAGTPWSMVGRQYNGGSIDDTNFTTTFATDEDWFVAMVWDVTADQATWYFAKDGDVALTTVAGATGRTWNGHAWQGIFFGATSGANDKGANVELTNWKAWRALLSSADVLSEMKSELPVTHTGDKFGHWKMTDSSDLADYSGNGRDLTATGTVTSGTMDPQDIIAEPAEVSDAAFTNIESPNLSGGLQ